MSITIYSKSIILILLCICTTSIAQELKPVKVTTTLGVFYGYENSNGERVIKPKYTEAKHFYNGLALVKNDKNLYGFINKKGEEVIPPQFDYADEFSLPYHKNKVSSIAIVRKKTTEEYTKKGINATPFHVAGMTNKRTREVFLEGVINTEGKLIVPIGKGYSSNRYGNLAHVHYTANKDRYELVLDSKGNIVLGPINASLNIYNDRITATYRNAMMVGRNSASLTELYDLDGNLLVDANKGYWSISETTSPDFFVARRYFMINDEQKSRVGFINSMGEEVLQTLYEEATWETEMNLGKVYIQDWRNDDIHNKGVYFYVDKNMNCIAKPDAPCPEEADIEFDYQSFLAKDRQFKSGYKKTAELPWGNASSAESGIVSSSAEALTPMKDTRIYFLLGKVQNDELVHLSPVSVKATPEIKDDYKRVLYKRNIDPNNVTRLHNTEYRCWKSAMDIQSPGDVTFTFQFEKAHKMKYVLFQHANNDIRHLKSALLRFSDGSTQQINIDNTSKEQIYEIEPVTSDAIVLQGYEFYEDNRKTIAINQIHFFAEK